MPEMIEPIGKDRVPFFALSENYKIWVDDFYKMETALIQLQKLKTEKDAIRIAPRAKSDLIKILKQSYADHLKNMAVELAGLISNYGPSAFGRLPLLSNTLCHTYIPKEVLEAALTQLAPDQTGAMTTDEKTNRLKTIEKKISDAKAEIKKFTPQAYIQMRNGNVQCDSRAEFVKFWRDKQAWIAGPCNPQGLDLTLSGDDEKWAYERLGIAKSMLPKAQKLPYRQ